MRHEDRKRRSNDWTTGSSIERSFRDKDEIEQEQPEQDPAVDEIEGKA